MILLKKAWSLKSLSPVGPQPRRFAGFFVRSYKWKAKVDLYDTGLSIPSKKLEQRQTDWNPYYNLHRFLSTAGVTMFSIIWDNQLNITSQNNLFLALFCSLVYKDCLEHTGLVWLLILRLLPGMGFKPSQYHLLFPWARKLSTLLSYRQVSGNRLRVN